MSNIVSLADLVAVLSVRQTPSGVSIVVVIAEFGDAEYAESGWIAMVPWLHEHELES